MAGARLGSPGAIARLAELRAPGLLRHAMRLLGNREDAQDAVHEAWIEILRGLPSLRDDRAFSAWAYRIVTRRAARIIAGNVKRRSRIDPAADPDDIAESGADFIDTDVQAIRRAIQFLPPPQAAAISLFYLDDMSVAQVAVALDVPPGTIKTRLMHARTKLSKALKGNSDE